MNAEWRAWFADGAKPDDFPPGFRDSNKCSTALVITEDGAINVYQSTPYPIEIVGPTHAIGSGAEAAMAVMALGHDARKAVEIASLVCSGCGNGIDTLTHE